VTKTKAQRKSESRLFQLTVLAAAPIAAGKGRLLLKSLRDFIQGGSAAVKKFFAPAQKFFVIAGRDVDLQHEFQTARIRTKYRIIPSGNGNLDFIRFYRLVLMKS